MSQNDPTLQENQTDGASTSGDAANRSQENLVENTAVPGQEPTATEAGGPSSSTPPDRVEPTPKPVESEQGAEEATSVPVQDQPAEEGGQLNEPSLSEPQPAPSTPAEPPVSPPASTTPTGESLGASAEASGITAAAAESVSVPAASEQASTEVPTAMPESSGEVASASTEGTERPRVTLDRSADDTAKAVPTLSPEETAAVDQQMAEAGVGRATGPVTGVEIPRTAELDAAMERELEEALAKPSAPPESVSVETGSGEAAQPVSIETLEVGTRLKGTVQVVTEETVFVDLGLRSPGMVPTRQFGEGKKPEVGHPIEVVVDAVDAGAGTLTVSLPKARRKPAGNWDAVAKGQVVDAMVTKTNKGGLEVTVSSLRGFLPASQVDLGFVENLEAYVGQKLTCVITEVNPQKRNLVLSRRAHLQMERKEKEKELWDKLAPGQQLEGTVKTIKDYGAFVDLGGVDGFLHVGEISWNRISHPRDVLSVGQSIQVSILKIDPETRKIGLGLKQLQANPWSNIEGRYPVGATVSGKVTRTTDFGAFIELEEGVEGLIHISELDHRRVGRVTEVINEGDQVDVKVLAVEPSRKRISLSLKALKSKPEPAKEQEPEVPAYERKRKGPLRGGRETHRGGSGGLFGNPDDYR